jgi:hypothetical protein
MSDLISRKAVIGYIREQHDKIIIEQHRYSEKSNDELSGMKEMNEAFNTFIMMMPIAYDVNDVLEQLCELRDTTINTEYAPCDTYGTSCVDKAIEIVKGGGQGE